MTINIISDLEEKVNRAIEMIGELKENKRELEKENENLNRQVDGIRAEFDEYKKTAESKISEAINAKPDFDVDEVKTRLSKLAGKLAALEDSWT
jgi:regulator of replication initiation timing